MAYKFVCENNPRHVSYSASKTQKDPSCPKCGGATHLVRAEREKKS
jgi:hypothetical protein